jgi:16S rRNA (cytidine1402-2'-O)-methyltransferase
MSKMGKLYIVATPIGNPEDITLRALKVLASVDAVICEERRAGSTLLKRLGVTPRELLPLNEHNEPAEASQIALRMVKGENFALISDAGTPVFADPGAALIRQAVEYGVETVPVPGPSSLMAALSVLDFPLEQYVFGGFLSRVPEQRRKELQRLRGLRMPVVLLDTPYRLNALLDDIARVFGQNQRLTLAFDLTLPGEMICRGTPSEIKARVGQRKGEFVLIIHAG